MICLFSSRSFIVSELTFRLLIHLEFIFVYSVRECSHFILLHVAVNFPSTTYWRNFLFSIVCSCLCHRLVEHKHLGLSQGFLSCSTDLYFCFVPVWCCCGNCIFVVYSKVFVLHSGSSSYFFKIALPIWGLLCFHTNFKILYYSSVKNAIGNLIDIALNL